jgi:hypothetical protein
LSACCVTRLYILNLIEQNGFPFYLTARTSITELQLHLLK